ncbi:MAG: ABC transporter permease [Candidatus Methylomirabilota bacterium]|nr:phosphate/phosphonate ABC transporter permease [candidate division NC10 bacterium]PWB45917.1 MAG: ABC transporter permease [candidate division NC10 bacterium]
MQSNRSPVPASLILPARRFSTLQIVWSVLFILTFLGSYRLAQVKPLLLFEPEGRRHIRTFVAGMFPPDLSWDFLSLLGRPIIETIQLSVMGTFMAVVIGLPLGLAATRSLTFTGILNARKGEDGRRRIVLIRKGGYLLARATLSLFRTIPEFVWAFMFVRAVGLGPFPGVLAIGISYAGMLGKVYSEILEHANPGPLEALQATGASRSAILLYGLLPQALPNLVSYTLYRWECAIRASTILGFVGAGGIGQQLEISMRMFNFNQVLTLVAILFVMVAGVDTLSAKIRSAILGRSNV